MATAVHPQDAIPQLDVLRCFAREHRTGDEPRHALADAFLRMDAYLTALRAVSQTFSPTTFAPVTPAEMERARP